jgi:intracellular sulfur oxidation DsrE/DsrF family protein
MSDDHEKKSMWESARRRWLGLLVASGGAAALGGAGHAVAAVEAVEKEEDLRFPGEEPGHRLVYQFNEIDGDYQKQVLFSAGAVLRKYGDDVKVVVVCFGPGIHILAREPKRPVSDEIRQRVASLAEYGVEFHACNNTLKSLGWTEDDLLPFAKVVDSGAADLMELQEQGYAYISW